MVKRRNQKSILSGYRVVLVPKRKVSTRRPVSTYSPNSFFAGSYRRPVNYSASRPAIFENSFFGSGRTPRSVPRNDRPNGRNPYYRPLQNSRTVYYRPYPNFYGPNRPYTFMDYYKGYAFAKPRVIGTVRDVYKFSQPRLAIAGQYAVKEARLAGGFIAKEARVGYNFVKDKLEPKKKSIYGPSTNPSGVDIMNIKSVSAPKPKYLSSPGPTIIPMVKKRTVDGIEVYEREE